MVQKKRKIQCCEQRKRANPSLPELLNVCKEYTRTLALVFLILCATVPRLSESTTTSRQVKCHRQIKNKCSKV